MQAPSMYDGPFRVRREAGTGATDSGDKITVDQGYVYAGAVAEYDFPQAGDTDAIDVSGWADATYNVIMEVTVDDMYGYFTASDKPVLHANEADSLATAHHGLQTTGQCDVILARIIVAGGKVMSIRQDQRSHVYVPVRAWLFTTPDTTTYYFASWESQSHRLYYTTGQIQFNSTGHTTSHESATVTYVASVALDQGYESTVRNPPALGAAPTEKCH